MRLKMGLKVFLKYISVSILPSLLITRMSRNGKLVSLYSSVNFKHGCSEPKCGEVF